MKERNNEVKASPLIQAKVKEVNVTIYTIKLNMINCYRQQHDERN